MNTSYQGALRAPYQPSSFALVLAGVVAAIRKVGQVLKNRHDAAILAQFDDRMLSDIGLTRSEVMGALAEPFLRQRAVHLVRRDEQSSRPEKVGTPTRVRPAVSFAAQTGSRA